MSKMTGEQWREWSQKQIAIYHADLFQARLNQGKGKKVVLLPFIGEFGHLIMHYIRLAYFMEADYRVICCQPGQEVLFPNANEFYYDWENPIPDEKREGTDRWVREWPEIKAKFPGYHFAQAGGLSFAEEKTGIHPEIRIPLVPKADKDPGLKVDVCIGTRSRGLNPRQNWQHCQLIANACKARGLTFATIAHPSVGYHLEGELCMSGDHPGMDTAIHLLQGCKFYFGQDSGAAHLASTVGVNMAVLQVPHRIWAEQEAKKLGLEGLLGEYGRDFIDRMIETNAPNKVMRIQPELWFTPEEVVKQIEPELDLIAKSKSIQSAPIKKRKKGKK